MSACTHCGSENLRPDGACRDCLRNQNAAYKSRGKEPHYQAHNGNEAFREAYKARNRYDQRKWRQEHPGYYAEMQAGYRRACTPTYLVCAARHRAKKAGWAFDEIGALLAALGPIPDKCPLCQKLLAGTSSGSVQDRPSIDRVDPDRGYVSDNVSWLCGGCNRRKSDASYAWRKDCLAYENRHRLNALLR
jgi:hypothetical protein